MQHDSFVKDRTCFAKQEDILNVFTYKFFVIRLGITVTARFVFLNAFKGN